MEDLRNAMERGIQSEFLLEFYNSNKVYGVPLRISFSAYRKNHILLIFRSLRLLKVRT